MKRKQAYTPPYASPLSPSQTVHKPTRPMHKATNRLFAMHTRIILTTYGEHAQEALAAASLKIKEVESLWSVTDTKSDIYKANHSGGRPVRVSEQTASLIRFALQMAQQTNGALEPTLYPVLTAWGFTTDTKQVPSKGKIQRLLANVGYERIRLQGRWLTVPDGMALDLGAVGKGYTADLIAEVFKEYDVSAALIDLGGNIQTVGSRPDGSDWRIGVRAPWERGHLGVLQISDAAVVTSGGYENYFIDKTGHPRWHILDPHTGYPAESDLQSVTVIGTQGKRCDALSTALFVMGAREAENYWREHGGFDMLLMTKEDQILLTQGIAARFIPCDGRARTIRVLQR